METWYNRTNYTASIGLQSLLKNWVEAVNNKYFYPTLYFGNTTRFKLFFSKLFTSSKTKTNFLKILGYTLNIETKQQNSNASKIWKERVEPLKLFERVEHGHWSISNDIHQTLWLSVRVIYDWLIFKRIIIQKLHRPHRNIVLLLIWQITPDLVFLNNEWQTNSNQPVLYKMRV